MRIIMGLVVAFGVITPPAAAQSATTSKGARTAYGARLTEPEGITVNDRRVNSRINNRINNRISSRIQRYFPLVDPVAAYRKPAEDGSRRAGVDQPIPQAQDGQE